MIVSCHLHDCPPDLAETKDMRHPYLLFVASCVATSLVVLLSSVATTNAFVALASRRSSPQWSTGSTAGSEHDVVRPRCGGHGCPRMSTDIEQKQKKPPGATGGRKLNPLETLIKVYTDSSGQKNAARPDRRYPFFTGLPLKPYFDRATVRTEEIPGTLWTFEQPQEFFNVSVNIRMTALKLESGGLWVHAPVAPTDECIQLLTELGEEVCYIILPTTAFEHKVYVKPFSDRFPEAKVYVCPGQWSWPINLPPAFRVDGTLCEGEPAPWQDEIDCKLFSPPLGGVGPSNEVIFFHKATKTLLVTDSVICIPREPPAVVNVGDLLQAAAEEGQEALPDSPTHRRQGWEKMCLQVLFLGPALPSTFGVLSEKLVVSPVLRILTLGRVLPYVQTFVSDVCSDWPDIRGFLACHYSGLVPATTRDFRRAFGFAFTKEASSREPGEGTPDVKASSGSDGGSVGGVEGALKALGLADFFAGFLGGGTAGGDADDADDVNDVDVLADVPEEDFETLKSVNDFVVKYGLADTG